MRRFLYHSRKDSARLMDFVESFRLCTIDAFRSAYRWIVQAEYLRPCAEEAALLVMSGGIIAAVPPPVEGCAKKIPPCAIT